MFIDDKAPAIAMTLQQFIQAYYGIFLVILMILLWIGRLVTWRYDISINKGTCSRKIKRVPEKFYVDELVDYDY